MNPFIIPAVIRILETRIGEYGRRIATLERTVEQLREAIVEMRSGVRKDWSKKDRIE